MNDLKVFNHKEFGGIRALEIDGQPHFVGKDVAEVLKYQNSRDALKKHVDPEDKGVANCDTLGGKQDLVIINESGLYSLILSSKLPKAKEFKRWVTSEVLPSIRKHGGYIHNGELDYLIKTVVAQTTKTIMEQLPEIVSAAVKQIVGAAPLPATESKPPQLNPIDWNEAAYWEGILTEWRDFRAKYKNKAQADKDFVAYYKEKYPASNIGRRTLYRKWRALTEKGSAGLIDMRGRHGNHHRRKIVVTVEIDEDGSPSKAIYEN